MEQNKKRAAGILLPVTSLPSDYGIGCFSKEAYKFADWLAEAKQSYWQILPIGPTSFGDSPYQSFSSYAGNPYMIDLERLIDEGLLTKKECDGADFGTEERYIDYEKLYNSRYKLLKTAYVRSGAESDEIFKRFCRENEAWLEDYALFTAVKEYFKGTEHTKWNKDIAMREDKNRYAQMLSESVEFYKYIQYKFYEQWESLKEYVNNNGIEIIGDLPIYVSADSADVWANPKLFMLDEKNNPTFVAGCPPDGFSPKGQLWGNPIYNWEEHKRENYKWWINRIRHAFRLFDIVRIDHFRGFDQYYQIPSGSEDAILGEWKTAPGEELVEAIKKELGEKRFIAEDLGFVTNSVKELLKKCGFPGMRVLQFAFDVRDTGNTNDYLPHNYINNCAAYTGTHDNPTIAEWYTDITPAEEKAVRDYLCDWYTPAGKMNIPLIGAVMRSVADICIIPLQDYMGLGKEARINIPSTVGKNWIWRLKKGEADEKLLRLVKKITVSCGRAN